jgi:hypothetical protein
MGRLRPVRDGDEDGELTGDSGSTGERRRKARRYAGVLLGRSQHADGLQDEGLVGGELHGQRTAATGLDDGVLLAVSWHGKGS